ncbi:hypothetical protein PSV08DRAFT_250529 [Bipolaris maydis]|uniref:uncharacterized protein n=1 Tax=Cochliobolus heterostrophus TaxID=5016 RepID=UPI0024D9891F|nr:hypothetical protein J3E74DRAFT_295635 [Bipolaris maydis]KAJ6267356.1 hypothetical protein PSV08DRAFT_250529 [Bipolaris maydis]
MPKRLPEVFSRASGSRWASSRKIAGNRTITSTLACSQAMVKARHEGHQQAQLCRRACATAVISTYGIWSRMTIACIVTAAGEVPTQKKECKWGAHGEDGDIKS